MLAKDQRLRLTSMLVYRVFPGEYCYFTAEFIQSLCNQITIQVDKLLWEGQEHEMLGRAALTAALIVAHEMSMGASGMLN
jgi:hypothetical protein